MRGATPMRPTSAASGLPIPPTAALEPHGRTVMYRMRMISRVSALVLVLRAMTAALPALVATDTSIKGMNGKPIIGVIGGTKSVGIDKFIVGYIQGARDMNPKAEVKVAYSNNFGDPAIGLQMAKAMFDGGANVV